MKTVIAGDLPTALSDARTLAASFMPAAKAPGVRSFAFVTVCDDGNVEAHFVVAQQDADEYARLMLGCDVLANTLVGKAETCISAGNA